MRARLAYYLFIVPSSIFLRSSSSTNLFPRPKKKSLTAFMANMELRACIAKKGWIKNMKVSFAMPFLEMVLKDSLFLLI